MPDLPGGELGSRGRAGWSLVDDELVEEGDGEHEEEAEARLLPRALGAVVALQPLALEARGEVLGEACELLEVRGLRGEHGLGRRRAVEHRGAEQVQPPRRCRLELAVGPREAVSCGYNLFVNLLICQFVIC